MPRRSLTRWLPYDRVSLYELVRDVARYPEFVPGWRDVRVRPLGERSMAVEQTVRIGPFVRRLRSTAETNPPQSLHIHSNDAAFGRLDIEWGFAPNENGTRITLVIDWEARVRSMAWLLEFAMARRTNEMIDAFVDRAHSLLGTAAGRHADC